MEDKTLGIEGKSARRRILVVDDDEDIRTFVCHRLLAMGFDVADETNGLSGLSRLAAEVYRFPFCGILLDLQMPVLGGMAVLQEVRERYHNVPVIVMSDAENIGKLREAVKLGAKEYLVKPFDAELFNRKCRRIFLEGSCPP